MAGLDSRVYIAGLVSRVCPGGTKYSSVDSLGGPQFWGTVNSVTKPNPLTFAALDVYVLYHQHTEREGLGTLGAPLCRLQEYQQSQWDIAVVTRSIVASSYFKGGGG